MESGSETEQRQLRDLRLETADTERALHALRLDTANTELRAAAPFLGLPKAYADEALDRPVPMHGQRVVAIIPAHNEQHGIAVSVGSLSTQTRPADAVIVMIDNCTDHRAWPWPDLDE